MYQVGQDITHLGLAGDSPTSFPETLRRLDDLHEQLVVLIEQLQSAVINELRWPVIT
jgi:hypothetical protein